MTGTSDGTVDTCAGINFVPFFVEAFQCGPFFPDVEGFPLSASFVRLSCDFCDLNHFRKGSK